MVALVGKYDKDAVPDTAGFTVIPAGEYIAEVLEAEIGEISQRKDYGRCLKLTWQIREGSYENRLIWQRIPLWPSQNMNNAPVVEKIANAQFAAIRNATGILAPADTEEFLHLPCLVTIIIRKDPTGTYDPENRIRSVRKLPLPVSEERNRYAEGKSGEEIPF